MALTRAGIEKIYSAKFADGNRVELLASGSEALERILALIREARESVCVMFYIFRDDETGVQFANALKQKAREGVRVYLLYDSIGSFGTNKEFWQSLREAGVQVRASRPISLLQPLLTFTRDHRKLVLIDGQAAFTGGLNMGNEYFGFLKRKIRSWRDTGVILHGPVAMGLFATYQIAWRRWGERALPAPSVVPEPSGPMAVMPVFSHSVRTRRRLRQLLHHSISNAQRDICLTTAYFIPSLGMIRALGAAVTRGVRVRLLLPEKTDIRATYYASRASFGVLLRRGVEIYVYNDRMLHAKTYIFDHQWSIVGSMNLDFLSLRVNDEGSVGILHEGFASSMVELFERDLKDSTRIDPETWHARGLWQRAKEWFFDLFRRNL